MSSLFPYGILQIGDKRHCVLRGLMAGAVTLFSAFPRLDSQAKEANAGGERNIMSIQFNHTIVYSRDKHQSAKFLTEVLGLPEPVPFSHFLVVKLANDVSLDFLNTSDPIKTQHYAFLVSESEFDEIFSRIKQRRLTFWADPGRKRAGEINDRDGGRGLYFTDPSGHFLEILTRPYGSKK